MLKKTILLLVLLMSLASFSVAQDGASRKAKVPKKRPPENASHISNLVSLSEREKTLKDSVSYWRRGKKDREKNERNT